MPGVSCGIHGAPPHPNAIPTTISGAIENGTGLVVDLVNSTLVQANDPYKVCIQYRHQGLYFEVGENSLATAQILAITPQFVPKHTEVSITMTGLRLATSDIIRLMVASPSLSCMNGETLFTTCAVCVTLASCFTSLCQSEWGWIEDQRLSPLSACIKEK